jgi:replicative DNA helicase
MNISSALINKIIVEQDMETWGALEPHYLPTEYQPIFRAVETHFSTFKSLPTFDDLKLSLRDQSIKEKIFAIETLDVDSEASHLLEYLKNEYTHGEILNKLDKDVDTSVAMSSAEEHTLALEDISVDMRNKVEIEDSEEINMQKINPLETEEQLTNYIPLGLNTEYDAKNHFAKTDLVLIGGRRGSGKSLVCANIAVNQYDAGKSSLFFTIEMTKDQTFRRMASIATGIPLERLRNRMLTAKEFNKLAEWNASRYEGSTNILNDFYTHGDYDKFQETLIKLPLRLDRQLDMWFDPALTLAKIKAEVEVRMNYLDIGVVIVDYINQVKRSSLPSKGGQYDWTEQIEVSKTLKQYAQEHKCLYVSPYQVDATGEARFAKGILDAADAAYSLETWEPGDNCMTFECKKMRNGPIEDFSSQIEWDTLKIGPQSAMTPKQKDALKKEMSSGEDVQEL